MPETIALEQERARLSAIKDPPTHWLGVLKQLGPGLIISAAVVGSGELIVTTKVGAEHGFKLLWFIIFACMIKVFVQIEVGRHALTRGVTTLQAMDAVPGPRYKVSWMVWIWMLMFVATFFQLAGIIGTIAEVFNLAGSSLSTTSWAVLVTGSCAVLLYIGRYGFIEKASTIMVAIFTICTMVAVFGLIGTPYSIGMGDLAEGFSFQLPSNFAAAFAAFGIVGVGASELIYYPYWCLEKGYAAFTGPNDGSAAWEKRARGWLRIMKIDAWISMVVYTVATISFYLLGAAVLHGKSLAMTNADMVPSLSQLYQESFGRAGLWIFVIGAFVVLYSTVFIATASNGRLCADILKLLGVLKIPNEQSRGKVVQIACVLLPALYLVFFLTISKPLTLVTVGAIAQAVMLPLLALAALYFHRKWNISSLRPSSTWTLLLWISAILMTLVGGYSLSQEIAGAMKLLGVK
ncbi:MAG TPA: Nramp family divalent metal transporter [Methylomirabilota bacterium]|nr:Nramp family divalent metal transporter [Methylomirabilota bacterium]